MTSPTPPALDPADRERSLPATIQRLAAAHIDKLELEIAQLRTEVNSNGWSRRIGSLTPLLSVVIAVGGFLFGIYQFQAQQRELQNRYLDEKRRNTEIEQRQQRLNIQADVRADAQELFHFFNDTKQTIAIATFRLQTLRANIALGATLIPTGTSPSLFDPTLSTAGFVRAVMNDCDLAKPRDAAFVRAILDTWPDYSRHLSEDQKAAEFIAQRYAFAAEKLAFKAPVALASVRDNPDNNSFTFAGGISGLTNEDLKHFNDLVVGFQKHLVLIPDHDERADQLRFFGEVINNDVFVSQLNKGSRLTSADSFPADPPRPSLAR
jgi:hypothetical protein